MVTLLPGLLWPFDLVLSLPSFLCWPCFAICSLPIASPDRSPTVGYSREESWQRSCQPGARGTHPAGTGCSVDGRQRLDHRAVIAGVELEDAQEAQQYVVRGAVFGMVFQHRALEVLYCVYLAVGGAGFRRLFADRVAVDGEAAVLLPILAKSAAQ